MRFWKGSHKMARSFSLSWWSITQLSRDILRKGLFRDRLKALEMTTAIRRCKISCNSGGDCWVSDLSLHGCCKSQSLQDSAEVVISRLLPRNCCGLVVVVSAIIASRRWPFASQRWPGAEVVISRLLPLCPKNLLRLLLGENLQRLK